MHFTRNDYWQAIILYGLNAATYKMALAKVLLDASLKGESSLSWQQLSDRYLDQYVIRLSSDGKPQQSNPTRLTKMERICAELAAGKIDRATAIVRVGDEAFTDVIPRFHTIGRNTEFAREQFYEIEFGKKLTLKDDLLLLDSVDALEGEVDARWGLLEGAFVISQSDFELANDIRSIYIESGYARTALTSNIPFLQGYQGNVCFYCGEPLGESVHVDHVLPRQVLNHDEVWNLVLSHPECNMLKSDRVVGPHFFEKLIARNENIMGSNHPWKSKIATALGTTARSRASAINQHYDNVKAVLGSNYWGGTAGYNPTTDPFYRKLITHLNND